MAGSASAAGAGTALPAVVSAMVACALASATRGGIVPGVAALLSAVSASFLLSAAFDAGLEWWWVTWRTCLTGLAAGVSSVSLAACDGAASPINRPIAMTDAACQQALAVIWQLPDSPAPERNETSGVSTARQNRGIFGLERPKTG